MADRLINTFDQLVAAGGGCAIVTARSPGRTPRARGWSVYRINKSGQQVVTDPKAAWYEHGMKTFDWFGKTKAEAMAETQAWIAEEYGEHGPWARNAMRDYVPERINKAFPLPKKEKCNG